MDKRNRPALGFLLAGLGVAGRALLAVPEGVSMFETTLTVLILVGCLVLGRRGLPALGCITAGLVLELLLCGSQVQAGGAWLWGAPLLRLVDLWLMTGCAALLLAQAAGMAPALGRSSRRMPVAAAVLLGLFSAAQIGTLLCPETQQLHTAVAVLFVVYSLGMLWFTILMIRAYNALRVKPDRRRTL